MPRFSRLASFVTVLAPLSAQQQWMLVAPPQHPSPRLGAAMAYCASLDRIVLFGGQAQPAGWPIPFFADTWTYNGITWSQAQPAVSPPARSRHAMVASSGFASLT